MLIVAGIRLERDRALALASTLSRDGSDRTARVLLTAVTKGQVFVALTIDDKECILAALTRQSPAFADLRGALFDELNWQRRGLEPPALSYGLGALAERTRERVNVAWV